MSRRSAGLLLYRRPPTGVEVLLVHPGGPYWRRQDAGAWSVPKGEYGPQESPEAAARREMMEETGLVVGTPLLPLGTIRQKGGKEVTAFATEGDFDPATLVSNSFEMEWPPRSGHTVSFPEVDQARWFPLAEARIRLLPAQVPFLHRLEQALYR
ncbi:NUDIX hydrolase [Haematobacter missouriensis]|uniref:NUDIX domain-containing protein n=1 Tax=Haematobacter missouriensis TaxID=366616 RepID=A0A212APD3_9RHOB|nr:NUDIX domain-containing protein [Haematobacter missouriensis]KFI28290.1 NUDIX hydrolase [Haematobacter missouriensis]OWJ74758.1 NUDIX domain-containing protein [Haematobacter missouriensis]OWJ83325.1 NUDIX domain-containing protein [Haematobacter missouriensis]